MPTHALSQAVAQVIRSELGARRMDWTDFAAHTGRPHIPGQDPQPKTTVWRKLSGVSKMSVDDVAIYATALGWPIADLLARAASLQVEGGVIAPDPADPTEAVLQHMSPDAQGVVRATIANLGPPKPARKRKRRM